MLKNFNNFIKNKLLPSEGPSQTSLFNIAVSGGIITLIFNVIFVYSFGYNIYAKIINPVTLVLILMIYIFSDRFNKQRIGSVLIVISVNFIIFPYCFMVFGAVNGGMTSYFILGIIFTVLLMDGKALYILLPIEFVYYAAVFYFALHYPEKVLQLESQIVVYRTSYAYMAITAILTGTVIKIFLTEYQKEDERVRALLKQVQDLSDKDPLTSVYNRRYMLEFLDQKINQSKTEKSPLCIIMFDIDYFKRINDTYGHVIGDEVLKQICKIFLDSCRKDDIVARYGGEEFLIILPSTEFEIAVKRAEQIRVEVIEKVKVENRNETITISGGVVSFNNSDDIVEFIKRVDEKLYIAKSNGRNQIVK